MKGWIECEGWRYFGGGGGDGSAAELYSDKSVDVGDASYAATLQVIGDIWTAIHNSKKCYLYITRCDQNDSLTTHNCTHQTPGTGPISLGQLRV